jgi:hypothetical protein
MRCSMREMKVSWPFEACLAREPGPAALGLSAPRSGTAPDSPDCTGAGPGDGAG